MVPEIKAADPSLWVILMTGPNAGDHGAQQARLGALIYTRKPADMTQLIRMVAEIRSKGDYV